MKHLSNKAVSLLEIYSLNKSTDIVEGIKELKIFIAFLLSLQTDLVESKIIIPEYINRISTLATKTILNCNSIVTLLGGQKIESNSLKEPLNLLDIPSLFILTRSQLETYLMFEFIYCQPKSESEIEFRYSNWIYSGLLSRREFIPIDEEFQNKKNKDNEDINKFKKIIQDSGFLQTYSEKQQRIILENGEERLFNGWNEIMALSGFHKTHSKKLYRLLSAHAHTTGLGIINLDGAQLGYSNTHPGGYLIMFYSKMLLSRFITQFKDQFSVTKSKYETSEPRIITKIDFYSSLLLNGKIARA